MVKKIIILALIFFGIFLRLFQLDQIPGGLFADEISLAVNTKTITENGIDEYGRKFPYVFESVSDYKMPGYIYLSSIVYKFLGPQIITIKLISAFSAIISIFLIGYFAKTLFPKKDMLPWYVSLVLSLSLFHIHFSRIAYESMLANMFLLLYLISFIKLLRKQNFLFWIVLAALGIIGATSTYPAPRFIIPIFTVLVGLLVFITKPKDITTKKTLKTVGILLGITLISFIPAFLNSNVDKRPLSYILLGEEGSPLKIAFSKFQKTITSWMYLWNLEFLFAKGDTFAYRHGTRESGIFLGIFILPFVTGAIWFIRKFSKTSFSLHYLLIFTLLAGLPSALTSDVPYGPRIVPMMITYSVVIGLGLYYLARWLESKKQYFKISIWFIVLGTLFYQLFWFYDVYFIHFKRSSLYEFPKVSKDMGLFIRSYLGKNPDTDIYFLNGDSCQNWGHEDLQFWYFADLPNKEMIDWNNAFREVRYRHKGSPFDAYDDAVQPMFQAGRILMNPTYEVMGQAPSGTLLVRCGIHLENIGKESEEIIKVIYRFEKEQLDPYYVISLKK